MRLTEFIENKIKEAGLKKHIKILEAIEKEKINRTFIDPDTSHLFNATVQDTNGMRQNNFPKDMIPHLKNVYNESRHSSPFQRQPETISDFVNYSNDVMKAKERQKAVSNLERYMYIKPGQHAYGNVPDYKTRQTGVHKQANEISMTAEELEHLISQYKKPLMATAGLGLGLFAASPYLSVQAKRKGIEFGDDISNSNTAFSQTMKDHPYLGNIGGTIASSMGSVPFSLANPVLGTAAQMAGISASQAAAGAVIDKNPNSGIGAQFSKEHPYIGSALFGMVPGLHVNQEVAGEELARQALKEKEKSFMYNHPIASSYLSALAPFPGIFGSHSHAAARILNEQERQRNNGIRN